jgi:NNP family nitrate/nitrite transporter-like MFS transporter
MEMSEKEMKVITEKERSLQLAMATLVFFIGFAGVALFNISVAKISEIIKLTILERGILVAIPVLTGSLLRIPFAALVDNIGGKRVLIIQLIVTVIGLLGLFVVFTLRYISFEILILLGILAGVGISTFSPGITFVSYWYPKKRQGTALGIYGGLGNTAPAIFTVALPFAIAAVGLGYTYLIWAALVLAVIITFTIIGKDCYYQQLIFKKNYNKEEAERIARKMGQEIFPSYNFIFAIKNAIRILETHLLTITYFTSFGGFVALTAWLPTYWIEFHRVDIKFAGLLTGIMYTLITAIIRVPGGILSDKFGGEKIGLISYGILLAGSVLMMVSSSLILSIISVIIMAIGMGIANAAVFKLVPKYVTVAVAGASGWVGGIGAVGGLIIPPLMAMIVQLLGYHGYQIGFAIFVLLSIISIGITAYFMKKYGAM